MTNDWEFTDLEFVLAWEHLGEGTLPLPLTFRSRTPLWDDFVREKAETRDRVLPRIAEPRLRAALIAIARPDARVVVEAWDDRDPDKPLTKARLLGARMDGVGYLVTQLPGETETDSGDFTIAQFDADDLPARLVAGLPATEPGKRADVELVTLQEGDEKSQFLDEAVVGATFERGRRSAAFLSAPVACRCRIDVIQGRSVFGPRGITRHRIYLRDLEDDGRYAIPATVGPPVAAAIDDRRLCALIAADVAKVLQTLADEEM